MPKLLVIADDFTGALDTGVQFAKHGVSTLMTTDLGVSMRTDCEVLVVDSETRVLPPKNASDIVYSLVERAKAAGIEMIYKKTDSTLRGNIGAELSAAVKAAGCPLAFAPAYPQNGRTTENLTQYVDGVPIAETGLRNDPINPVTCSYIPDIIAQTAGVNDKASASISVYDARTDADLDNLFIRLRRQNELTLAAGCAGFAESYAKSDLFARRALCPERRNGNILAVCGSVNQASSEQCLAAKSAGLDTCMLPARALAEADADWIARTAGALSARLSSGFLLLHTDGDRTLPPDAPEHIAHVLGELTAVLLREQVSHLILFGGHTANAIMRAIGLKGFFPRAEISPGVVWSEAERFSVITKAGGFGKADVIQNILDYIRGV